MGDKIFISHAKADLPLVEALVELLRLGSDATRDDIVCTSLDGMKPPAGTSFVDWIRVQLAGASLVVEVITPAYWESRFCVCELGAQWGLGLNAHPLLAPGVDFEDLEAVLIGIQAGRLDSSADLDDLHDRVGNVVARKQSTANWSKEKKKFLRTLPRVMRKIPIAASVPRAEFEELETRFDLLDAELTKREEEVERLREALRIARTGATSSQVSAALASDDDEAFEELIDEARGMQRRLPSIVRRVVWQTVGSKDGAPYLPDVDEWPDVQVEIDNLRLNLGSDELVWAEGDDDDVSAAIGALEDLINTDVPDWSLTGRRVFADRATL